MAADYVRAKTEDTRQRATMSMTELCAMAGAPDKMNEIRQWAIKVSFQDRILCLNERAGCRIVKGTHPEVAKNKPAQIQEWAKKT
ncbi:MAG: hypothetical protein R3C68_16440 [Myxococcota bacterium]